MLEDSLKLTEKEYKDYFKAGKAYIGTGAYAVVFPYNKEFCLKLWRNVFNMSSTIDDYRINISSLLKNQNPMFVTPKRLVVMNKQIVGYLMPYIDGLMLKNIPAQISFLSLLEGMEKIEQEIANISKDGLYLGDVHNQNILYQKDGENLDFYFIDCDEWIYLKDKSYKNCLGQNLEEYRQSFTWLLENNEIKKFIKDRQDLLQQYNHFRKDLFKESYVQFIYEVKERIEKYTKEKIDTIEDYKRILKK